ncbi:glycosyltransferase family 4 protein [Klebsiella aerogenes]|uniref:glycosyltransferase family 4 protein n=1 Tax=Klebsiella aerogenes TaxID=548 RepID=UPI003514EFC1|nr:glycosyltransferase family 4 protein [Klebsiella aerogenes]
MRKIKILYVLPDMSNAGPVNMCLSLVKELDCNKYDISIFALGSGHLVDDFSKYGQVELFSRKDFFAFAYQIRMGGFDIMHSHCIIADIFLSLSFPKAKLFTTLHNYLDQDSIFRRGKFIGGLLYLIQKKCIERFMKVACSDSVRFYCEDKLEMSKINSIPNGVCDLLIDLKTKDNDKCCDFYYLGSLSNRKNVEFILRGFELWSNEKNARLHIIGDGENRNELEERFKSNSVKFYGKIDNPASKFVDFDCFVSASKAEGMPLALLESLSVGNAFICSDIDPHKEVYDKCQEPCGYLFKFDDSYDDYIRKLDEYYLFIDKAKQSKNARDVFLKNYTSAKMAKKYQKLYEESLSIE